MKKLFRTIIGSLCIIVGIAGIIFSARPFMQGVDIITGIVYASLIAISTSFTGLGLVIIVGGNVKEALHNIISGISF